MNPIFLRDLKRLAPYAAFAIAGTILLRLAAVHVPELGLNAAGMLVLGMLCGPGLLGVATVAPDTDSGALAFLARLPVSPARTIAMKLLAGAVWSVVVAAVPVALLHELGALRPAAVEIIAIGFSSGVVASVAMRRVLPATLLAPLIGSGTYLTVAFPADFVLDVRTGATGVGRVLLGAQAALFLAVSVAAFVRGDRHRDTLRPVAIVLATILLACPLAFGSVAAAHEWSVREAPRWVRVLDERVASSRDGRVLAIEVGGAHFAAVERRVAVVDRATSSAWLLPVRDARSPEVSPDGSKVLLRASRHPGGCVVDLASREVKPLRPAWRDAFEGFGATAVLWKGGEPFFARELETRIEVRAAGEVDVVSVPVGHRRIVGAAGARLILLAPGGVESLDPWTGEKERIELPGGQNVDAVVAPSGRQVLVLTAREGVRHKLLAVDFASRSVRPIDDGEAAPQWSLEEVVFSPDESRVVLSGRDGSAILVAIEPGLVRVVPRPPLAPSATGGAETALPVGERFARHFRSAWSPDGREVALPWGAIVDAGSGAVRDAPYGGAAVAFAGPGLVVRLDDPFSFRDARTGAVVARPLEGR